MQIQPPKVLRLRARGDALVQHFGTLGTAHRRFIGRKHDADVGHKVYIPEAASVVSGGGWPKHGTHDEIVCEGLHGEESFHYYARHVQEGSLWPADEATAALCRVKFDPEFGGELDE